MLLAHANQVDSVQMWVRNHYDSVVILEERESSAEYAIIDVITNASNSLRQLILFDFSSQKLADIVNEEARRWLVGSLAGVLVAKIFQAQLVAINDLVTHGVKVALWDVSTVAYLEPTEGVLFLEVSVVNLNLLVRYLDVVIVTIFAKFFLIDLECMDWAMVALGLVYFDRFCIVFFDYQLDVLHLFRLWILNFVNWVDLWVILLNICDDERVNHVLAFEDATNFIVFLLIADIFLQVVSLLLKDRSVRVDSPEVAIFIHQVTIFARQQREDFSLFDSTKRKQWDTVRVEWESEQPTLLDLDVFWADTLSLLVIGKDKDTELVIMVIVKA